MTLAAGALVAVVGPGGAEATALDLEQAVEVGRLLAARGYVVLTGGMSGVMAEAARGARIADGTAVGLLPGTDRGAGNDFLTLSVPTGLGQLRNGLLVNAADAVISVGCSWGTLSEIALAQRAAKPLACLRPWRLVDSAGHDVPLPTAATPSEAVAVIAAGTGR